MLYHVSQFCPFYNNNILLHIHTHTQSTVYLSIHLLMDSWIVSTFWLLWIVAAVNMGIVVQSLRCVQLFATPWTAACQASPSSTISQSLLRFSEQTQSIEHPLSQWCHPTISSSAALFFFCLQSSPASGSFPLSWLFASGGQSIGDSASTSVLPVNIQGWCPLGWTGLISLQSKWTWVYKYLL